jgi:hypothetical protein
MTSQEGGMKGWEEELEAKALAREEGPSTSFSPQLQRP